MLRLKAKRIIERAGLDPHSHNGKALVDILETFPRDEFMQATDTDLFEIARGVLLLQERQRVALFTRKDAFERFISCFVYVPRDRYTPDFKERAKTILEEAFEGHETQVDDHVGSSPLARGLFIVRVTPGKVPQPDIREVEGQLSEAARTWSDRLLDALTQHQGEERGIELHKRYKKAFPVAYSERFTAAAAIYDIAHVEEVLATGKLVVDLYRHRTEQRQFHVKIVHSGAPVPLSELMPRLECMGVNVQSRGAHPRLQPFRGRDAGRPQLGEEEIRRDVRPGLAAGSGERRIQPPGAGRRDGMARGDGHPRLLQIPSPDRRLAQRDLHPADHGEEPGHRSPAAGALPDLLRSERL
jgi:glutamate dehydrogenase